MTHEQLTTEQLLSVISKQLLEQKKMVATAESCTGGLIGSIFTDMSGSSEFFERGIISYSNNAKMQLLNVPKKMLDSYGAVSEPVAKAMAEGIRKNANVDIGIATTGIAGPTGGTKEKPVGLVYIAISTSNETIVKENHFKGNRLENKHSTVYEAFLMLNATLSKS